MARTEVTYGQLKALRDDILFLQKKSAWFFFINKPRVDRFFQVNQMHLKVLQSRTDEFITKYVKMDRDQQPCTEMEDGVLVYVFYSDEFRDNYLKALNNFLSLKISIDI